MGERRGVYTVLVGNLRERDHLEDPSEDGKIIVRWIFRKWDVGGWIGSRWLWIGTERSTYGERRGVYRVLPRNLRERD